YKILKEQYNILLDEILEPNMKFLDAGSGIGYFTKFLLSKGVLVDACDISPNALAILRKNNPKVRTICSSLTNLNEKDKYDAVHCFDVLYHVIDDKEWEACIKKFSLISNKYIILHQRFTNRKPMIISNHIKYRSYKEITALLESLGFKEYKSIPTHFMALRLFTYRISKHFPKAFYKLDRSFLNLARKSKSDLINNMGSHHIKVFKKVL
ncbi:MAG: class I SAM-dependent methyltransferase, partial [Candidatus Pacebacteria bacterium]|nr:class I SAM-dependent methyltransferase [Candidatus Paceibacterota bacterium]